MNRNETTVGLIGYGAIGRTLCAHLLSQARGPRLVGVLTRPGKQAQCAGLPKSVAVVTSVADLIALVPDIVVEAAGQEAFLAYAPIVLDAGIDVMGISTGALARNGILDDLLARAGQTGARLHIPAGAIAGLDGLGAHRIAGLTSVVYTSTKPPIAWRDTPAEQVLNLETLRESTVFFEGSARAAALAYPKNANLAATVGLAGIGLDNTVVRLVADPAATGNSGMIEAQSPIGSLQVRMGGGASANPKTSASTAFSLAHALVNLTSSFRI